MEYMGEDMPKILPVWHDLSFRHSSGKGKVDDYEHPDFGGYGVDVCGAHDFNFTVAKETVDKIIYGADMCALPFFPPKKVFLDSDPCLTSMYASNTKLRQFAEQLDSQKLHMKNEYCKKLRRRLSNLYSYTKRLQGQEASNSSVNPPKFRLPKQVLDLALSIPESNQLQEANFKYLGGCLVSTKDIDGNHVLLHPVGKTLNRLGMTPLVENYTMNKTFQGTSPICISKKLRKSCIQKIRSTFPGHSFVQQGKYCHYVNFTKPSEIETYELKRNFGQFVNIQSSQYNPVDFLSINKSGVLELFDVKSRLCSWTSKTSTYSKSIDTDTSLLRDCAFGSHPKSVLSLSKNSLLAFDLRSKEHNGSLLFSKFAEFSREILVNFKCLYPINSFQSLISTTNHLYLIDERYPPKPVLSWNHLLKSLPFYCDVTSISTNSFLSDAVALLGSQESSETCLFSIRFPKDRFQPVSLSNPLYPSVTTDFSDSLRLHGMHVHNGLKTRVTQPLIGVSIIPFSQRKGFTCFQLTSYGDIFYQDFKEHFHIDKELTYKVGTGCILTPPDKILPQVSTWNDFFGKNKEEQPYSRNYHLDSCCFDLNKFLRNTSDISLGCNLCAYNYYSKDRGVVHSSCCSSCGLSNKETNMCLEGLKNLSLFSGPTEESPNLDYFDVTSLNLDGDENNKILDTWEGSDDFKPMGVDSDCPKSPESCTSTLSPSNSRSFLQTLDESVATIKISDHADETQTNLNESQDFTCDLVPPSQEIRPLVGETLRTSRVQSLIITDSFGGGF